LTKAILKPILLILTLIFCQIALGGQTTEQPISGQGAEADKVPVFTDKNYEKATQGLGYNEKVPKPKKTEQTSDYEHSQRKNVFESSNWNLVTLEGLQILAILLALGLLAAGIYYFMVKPSDKKIKGDYDISIDQIEDRLHETDLMRYLREALAQKDYAVAIRLYYLQMLKDLSLSGNIKWSKEKTNRTYLNELIPHPLHTQMLSNMSMYETVWFGKTTLSERGFLSIEPDFRDILQRTGTSLLVTKST
jgi:hypothetical protein